jgi:N-acylneuraminate cytidylyltransferase
MKSGDIAIIPARGGSKRLPRKNIAPIAGKPVISYPLLAAARSGLFRHVFVSTEDEEIAAIGRANGAEVVRRPDKLAEDRATVAQVCEHVLETCEGLGFEPETFCCIYPTAVFVTADDLRRARGLLSSDPHADGVMSVSEYAIHPYKAMRLSNGYLVPEWSELARAQSQTYPRCYASNGTFYWLVSKAFRRQQSFYQPHLLPYVVPLERAVDIDTAEDLERARRLADQVGL